LAFGKAFLAFFHHYSFIAKHVLVVSIQTYTSLERSLQKEANGVILKVLNATGAKCQPVENKSQLDPISGE